MSIWSEYILALLARYYSRNYPTNHATDLHYQLYTLESRIAYAGWTEENLKDYKGPTPDLVAGLADHTRKTLGAGYVIGESGTAGPTGGTTKNRIP
jgi:hypothetical protein